MPASRLKEAAKRRRPLKVFRTSIGFDDAYVAAPSRKEALAAWGAGKDLFAIGSAEVVSDPALTKEPLASPGKVIRRSRGSLAAQLAAAEAEPERRASGRTGMKSAPREKPRVRAKPRPSRGPLEQAEGAVAAFEERARGEIAALRRREDELHKEREAIERNHDREAARLAAKLEAARERYDKAMARWRDQ